MLVMYYGGRFKFMFGFENMNESVVKFVSSNQLIKRLMSQFVFSRLVWEKVREYELN